MIMKNERPEDIYSGKMEIMKKVAIMTDSNSGITQKQGKKLGIHVLPMPFRINDEEFFEDITLSQKQFYERLEKGCNISTSQPTAGAVMEFWDRLLKDYDEVVHIPMSSGLSGSCQTAVTLSEDYGGKVQVVNNQRISVTQRQSAMDALAMAEKGMDAAAIRETLERVKLESSIYITVNDLKYLKRGGRITPAAAAIGAVLNLKPVLQIQGEKLDAYSKVRGMKQAQKVMADAMKKDFETRFLKAANEKRIHLSIAHTDNEKLACEYKKEMEEAFPGFGKINVDPLSLSIACHIGPGSLALACSVAVDEAG